jgi:hypothetical protein
LWEDHEKENLSQVALQTLQALHAGNFPGMVVGPQDQQIEGKAHKLTAKS